MGADHDGYDLVGAFHQRGRRVDAYTIPEVNPALEAIITHLLALRCDPITTDDPVGLDRLMPAPTN